MYPDVQDVTRVTDVFNTIVNTSRPSQNALSKLKAVTLQFEGLTNEGLDQMARLKGCVGSRTLNQGRHFMCELGESTFHSYLRQGKSYVTISDNLNIAHQNMTQTVVSIEQTDTRH